VHMRAALSSQEFARKCFGPEVSLKDTISPATLSQTPPILKQAKAEYAKLQ
jgi:hypothetical protein